MDRKSNGQCRQIVTTHQEQRLSPNNNTILCSTKNEERNELKITWKLVRNNIVHTITYLVLYDDGIELPKSHFCSMNITTKLLNYFQYKNVCNYVEQFEY